MDPMHEKAPARYRIVRHAGEYAGVATGFYYTVEKKGWFFWNFLFDNRFESYELALESLQTHIAGRLPEEGVVAEFDDQGELL